MRAMQAILLFLLTCAVALLLWVNWTSIENKITPEIQTQQETTDDDDALTENEEKGENDASEKENNS